MAQCPAWRSISVWMAIYPFCLVPFFPDPLCLSISFLLSPSSCHSFLPTSAINMTHICRPVVLYHLVCLGLSLFLSRPPASCFTPYSIPPSLSPSVCCQNPLHQFQMLSPRKHIPIHLSLSPQEPICGLSFLLLYIWLDLFLQSVSLSSSSCMANLSYITFFVFLFSAYYHNCTFVMTYNHTVAQ